MTWSATVAETGMTRLRRRLLGDTYGVNVVGAGVPGLAAVISPSFVAGYMFGAPRMLGSVWLAVGTLSLEDFRPPLRMLGILPVEALYESVWLATVAPSLLAGERPGVVPTAVFFAAPWVYLFGAGEQMQEAEAGR